jgi:hypothetical protein
VSGFIKQAVDLAKDLSPCPLLCPPATAQADRDTSSGPGI